MSVSSTSIQSAESGQATSQALTVEIWSDLVCPWCYIGKRRFETALAQFAHRDEVNVVWRSYQLNPDAPRREQGTLAEMLSRKYGRTLEQAAQMNQRVTDIAAEEGLHYHLDQAKPGNTFDGHRLVHLAAAKGLQDAAEERLMHAYFTEGAAIGEPETLVPLLAEIGVAADEARRVLESDDYADAVRADLRRAAGFGITGVPFFAIDETYGVSGAQPVEVILGALERAWAESHPLTLLNPDAAAADAACEDGACAVPWAESGLDS